MDLQVDNDIENRNVCSCRQRKIFSTCRLFIPVSDTVTCVSCTSHYGHVYPYYIGDIIFGNMSVYQACLSHNNKNINCTTIFFTFLSRVLRESDLKDLYNACYSNTVILTGIKLLV